MALTSNYLKKQVDLPVWEWTRFAPAVSSAVSCATSTDNSNFHINHGRYIYYLIAAGSFWKYDTWTDTYLQLSSPPTAPTTWSSMKFMSSSGFEGNVLSGKTASILAPGYAENVLSGYIIRITNGTGKGQERLVKSVSNNIVVDTGVATAVSIVNPYSITDGLKTWTINQWAGYQVRATYGSGISQVRRILYNNATTLFFADTAMYGVMPNCNPMPPSPAFSSTAGSQTHYAIEYSEITVDTNWDVIPDETSEFMVLNGAIMLASSAAATPFYTLQFYDIASDTWYIRTATSNLHANVGTDGTIDRHGESPSIWDNGIATTGTNLTIIDNTKNWIVDQWKNYWVRIYSGTGRDQLKQILSNTSTQLTFVTSATTAIDSTSLYNIEGLDAGIATTGGTTGLTDSSKSWVINRWTNFNVRIIAGTGKGQYLTIKSNTSNTLTTYYNWAVQPDNTSQYIIQGNRDNLYMQLGNTASMIVHNIPHDMATYGRNYDHGLTRVGSAKYGDKLAIPITSTAFSAGPTVTVTTTIPHYFKTGWNITHKGDTGASAAFTNITAPITVTIPTTYTHVATGAATSGNGTFLSLTTSKLVDSIKSGIWTLNQWTDYICYYLTTQGPTSTMIAMEIASNTTTGELTFKTAATLPVNGISRYIICPRNVIGAIDSGIATGAGQLTTALVDTSKNWKVNQFAGKRVKFVGGAGQSQESIIASNTSNTLTLSVAGTLPVANSTTYSILPTPLKGTGMNFIYANNTTNVNNKGKYIWLPRGGGVLGIDRFDITSDTWELTTLTPQIETLTSGSMYAYDGNDRIYFTKDATMRLYYLDLNTLTIEGAGMFPYVAGTAIIGNRMEIFKTIDGLKYLWVNRHSNQECFRALLFF